MKRSIIPLGVAIAILIGQGAASADGPPFELRDGDRVVLIGGTMIEREQESGYLETRLTVRYPDRPVAFFRNLGWSGDTVEGISQAGFGSVEDGFKHLIDHVLALKPTEIYIGYGANEAFDGPAGLPAFKKNLDRLIKALEPTNARLYFLAPNRQEDLGPPLPDPARHNADLALYRDALHVAYVAHNKKTHFVDAFVDLLEALPDGAKANPRRPLTDNGIHFNAYGYWRAAGVIEPKVMRSIAGGWSVHLDPKDAAIGRMSLGTNNSSQLEGPTPIPGGFRFRLLDRFLPPPLPPNGGPCLPGEAREVAVVNLAPGRYSLKIDGKVVASADADAWAKWVEIRQGPEFDQVEALRSAINAKNQLYFYRWRPQNETYLFGFRKHEQGQNAREIPQFDPLIAAKEAEIAKLRVPVAHTYELIREGEVGK